MIIPEFFNTAIGSCIIIILIAVDYLRKYNTDNFQRKLLLLMLGSVFFAALFEYISLAIERLPGENINRLLYYTWSAYLIARNCGYYFVAVFIDYFAHGNAVRTRKLLKAVTIFCIFYIICAIANIHFGFFFYITRDNIYIPGVLYILQLFISYLPILIILIDISLAPKHIKSKQVYFTIIFVILSAIGAGIDIIFKSTNLIWPCVTAGLLYIYFFIVKTDSKIDSLTGIGNRNSFNDYVKSISCQQVRKDHTFILIDIVQFREINNNFGHAEGDNALCDVALTIKSCIRNTDFAARLSGDEFVIVTSGASEVQKIIDRIVNNINIQNNDNTRPYKISLSYGHDVYKGNSGWQIHDFLINIETIKNKYKESIHILSDFGDTFYVKKINSGE